MTPAYAFGNAPRYFSGGRYPNYSNLDTFLQKRTRISGERMAVTIRFEALNTFNTVVFGAPGGNASTTTFGVKSTSQTNAPREAQLSARFEF